MLLQRWKALSDLRNLGPWGSNELRIIQHSTCKSRIKSPVFQWQSPWIRLALKVLFSTKIVYTGFPRPDQAARSRDEGWGERGGWFCRWTWVMRRKTPLYAQWKNIRLRLRPVLTEHMKLGAFPLVWWTLASQGHSKNQYIYTVHLMSCTVALTPKTKHSLRMRFKEYLSHYHYLPVFFQANFNGSSHFRMRTRYMVTWKACPQGNLPKPPDNSPSFLSISGTFVHLLQIGDPSRNLTGLAKVADEGTQIPSDQKDQS